MLNGVYEYSGNALRNSSDGENLAVDDDRHLTSARFSLLRSHEFLDALSLAGS